MRKVAFTLLDGKRALGFCILGSEALVCGLLLRLELILEKRNLAVTRGGLLLKLCLELVLCMLDRLLALTPEHLLLLLYLCCEFPVAYLLHDIGIACLIDREHLAAVRAPDLLHGRPPIALVLSPRA